MFYKTIKDALFWMYTKNKNWIIIHSLIKFNNLVHSKIERYSLAKLSFPCKRSLYFSIDDAWHEKYIFKCVICKTQWLVPSSPKYSLLCFFFLFQFNIWDLLRYILFTFSTYLFVLFFFLNLNEERENFLNLEIWVSLAEITEITTVHFM